MFISSLFHFLSKRWYLNSNFGSSISFGVVLESRLRLRLCLALRQRPRLELEVEVAVVRSKLQKMKWRVFCALQTGVLCSLVS